MTTGSVSQLSEEVALSVFSGKVLAVQSIVMFAGQTSDGAVLSSIVIVCTQVLMLLQMSVAVHVRVIVYSWEHVGDAVVTSANVITGTPLQLSVAVAFPVATGSVLAVHSMVRFAGHVMTGPTLSSMTIVWTHVLKWPHSSDAVQVRVMVYSFTQLELVMTSL